MSNHLFDEIRAHMPSAEAPFLKTRDGGRLVYGDVLTRSGQLANALVAEGIRPGDRVAVQVDKSPDAVMLYLACLRAGAVYLPLNGDYTASELGHLLGDAEPRLVVCAPARLAETETLARALGAATATLAPDGGGSLQERARSCPPEFRDAERGPDDLAAILYTSGTTGRSKGAMLTHENLASNARTLVPLWRFTSRDVLIHALPIFHTHGLFVAINVVLLAGASMIFLPKFDADDILRAARRATALMGVPTFYVRLLQHDGLTREAVANMRVFISGSAPLLAETHRAWKERTGHDILERYGLTETGMNTSNPYDGDRIAGTVGLPLPGVELRITDRETGATLGADRIGNVEIRGPNVFKGYWRQPEKTKAEFRDDGFFVTGDLGKIDGRGYLHIVGRSKDLIISGGFNVYPKEVETEINCLPGVIDSAVIGVPHADLGEAVAAIVVPDGRVPLDEQTILAPLADRLVRYKQPRRVIIVPELPRNATGKVQKNVLRERYKDLFATGRRAVESDATL